MPEIATAPDIIKKLVEIRNTPELSEPDVIIPEIKDVTNGEARELMDSEKGT